MKQKYIVIFTLLLNSIYIIAQPLTKTVFLEDLTWPEVNTLISDGNASIIIPTGGTEQNGPHMILGKHNYIMKYTSEKIALEIANTLVAPLIAYVPEGEIDPVEGHMKFPGTITLPEEYFMKLLEYTARSFKLHGFKNIILIGDSGGNQEGMKKVSENLNNEWESDSVKVFFISDYYDIEKTEYKNWLRAKGETDSTIGSHAGISATSQLMAIHPEYIRMNKLNISYQNSGLTEDEKWDLYGISGEPSRSSKEYGEKALQLKIEAAVSQIVKLMGK